MSVELWCPCCGSTVKVWSLGGLWLVANLEVGAVVLAIFLAGVRITIGS